MRNVLQLNKFAFLHDGQTIFFCKTDYLGSLFESLKSRTEECTIITGNSDYEITDEIVGHVPRCVTKWYAQNASATSEIIQGIPIGLENTANCIIQGHGIGWEHAKKKVEILSKPPINIKPTRKMYANFSLDTHSSRVEVARICSNVHDVTLELSDNHSQINNKSYSDYTSNILDHQMIVCPRGNGIDCHRIWEVLYLNRVPIVKKEKALRFFEELPILFLDSWDQLQDRDYIETQYNLVKNNTSDMLDMGYWNEKVVFGE